MKLTTYAEVFTPEHRLWPFYKAGVKKTPGHLLRDVLTETGGRYEVTTDLPERLLADVRRAIAAGCTDTSLTDVVESGEVRISLEHLRASDPATTRIVYGCALSSDDN